MTIIEQLEAVQAEMVTIKANLETASASILAKDEEINGLKGQLSDLQDAKDGIEATHAAAIADIQGKLDSEITAHAASKKQIEEFGRKLSDPAYKLASASGDNTPVADGGAVSGGMETKSLTAQMKEIKDPKERRAFYLKNEKEIKAGL